MVRSAPKEARDLLLRESAASLGEVSNAAPYFCAEGRKGTVAWSLKRPLKLQYQESYDGQRGRPRSRLDCLNPSRGGTHASGGNGMIAHV